MLTILSWLYCRPFSWTEAANLSQEIEPAPIPMRLSARLAQSLMSSPLRTTMQSLPDPTPATPTSDFAPWPSASEISCGPNAVSWMSPETSAVRASAKRWNMTDSIWMLYLAATSGSSQSGESAGTLSMPCLILTGCGNGVRRSPCASASPAASAATHASTRLRMVFMTAPPPACLVHASEFMLVVNELHRNPRRLRPMARIRDWSALDPAAQRRMREAARAHAAALNPMLNAFVEIVPPGPSDLAGPLRGLPYAAKDMLRTSGREPGCGFTGDLAPRVEGFSDLLDRLAGAGGDLIAFTGMTELAYEPSGFNKTLGRVRNPWNPDFVSGGSSSGSAAAVASGAVVAALGSDTGGSVRIPAHACGVTGWKPTHGLVSTAGAMALAPTLDSIGLLARGANDILLLAPFLGGPSTAAEPPRRAVVPDDVAAECEPAIRRCLADAVAAIEAAGVAVERRPALMPLLEAIDRHALIVMQGESARHHRSLLDGGALAPALRRRLAKGLEITDQVLAESVTARARLVREFEAEVLSDRDVLVLPVMPITTPRADRCDPASDRFSARALYALSRWTRFVNMLGVPAVAMPAGFDGISMPVGVQIVGRAGADLALLDLVRNVQASTSWHARVPDAVAHLIRD